MPDVLVNDREPPRMTVEQLAARLDATAHTLEFRIKASNNLLAKHTIAVITSTVIAERKMFLRMGLFSRLRWLITGQLTSKKD